MSAEIEIDVAFGYNGSSIQSLPQDNIAYICGSGVMFYNVQNGMRYYLQAPKRRPITTMTFNSKRSMFAISDRGVGPCIYLYGNPDRKLKSTITKATKLEFADVAFDRSGNHLVALGTLPEFELKVWNLEGREPQLLCETSVASSQPKFVSFNPLNHNELVTSGNSHVTFWKMETQQSKLTLNSTEGKAGQNTSRFHSHAWGPNGEVYAGCVDGEVYAFDAAIGLGEDLPEIGGTELTSCILVSRHHFVVGSEDGTLRFYSHATRSIEKTLQLNTTCLTYMQFALEWHTIYVGCGDGVVFSIRIPGYDKPNMGSDYFREISPKVTILTDFHSGPVTCCAHLTLERCLATAGQDGTLRIWDYGYNCLKSKIPIGANPVVMACGPGARTQTTLALGFDNGTVRLVDATEMNAPKVTFRELLDRSKVVTIKFDPDGNMLCVLYESATVFFLDAAEGTIIGYLDVLKEDQREANLSVLDLAWVEDNPETPQVLVSLSNSDMLAFNVPSGSPGEAEGEESDPYLLPRDDHLDNVWKLDYAAVKMVYAKGHVDKHQIFTIGVDKCVKVVYLTKEKQLELKEENVPLSFGAVSFPSLAKAGAALQLTGDKSWLLACGQDGKATVRDVSKLLVEDIPKGAENIPERFAQRHWPYDKAINAGCWSSDGKTIFTVGNDGFTFCYKLKGSRKDVPPFTLDAQVDVEDEAEEEDIFTVKRKKEEDRFAFIAQESYREQVKQKVAELATRLQGLREKNKEADYMERLGPEEFMIASAKEEAKVEGDRKVEEVREEERWKNVARDFLADKIKKEAYDVMETKLVIVHALIADLEVCNYNIRNKDKAEAALLRKLKFLRKVEKTEWETRTTPYFLDDIFEEEEISEADAEAKAKAATKDAETKAAAAADRAEKEAAGEIKAVTNETLADESTQDIMYSPFEEYTRQRAVLQMHLLNGEINYRKVEYNKLHNDMLARKKAEIARILDKNQRIAAILGELESDEEIYKPSIHNDEIPEKILQANDNEISVEKYLSPEELAKQEKLRLEAEARRKEQEDDSVERGLKIMMDGKLERDEAEVVIIKKPEFAETKPQEEWTDEEAKAYKDYETKLKKKEEEDEKKKRSLESELKGLRKEVTEITTAFDTALLNLLNTKMDTDQSIYELELRIIKLSQYVMQREEMRVKEQKLAGMLEEIRTKTAKSAQHVQDFKRELDAKSEQYQMYVAEEKNADKKFRVAFAEAEEFLEVLLKLLKKKNKPQRKGKAAEKEDVKEETLSIDPFAAAEAKAKVQGSEPEVKLDKPEGLNDMIWQEFLAYRQQRIEMEREMKDCAQELADMQKYHQKIKTDNEELHQKMELNLRRLNEFRDLVARDAYNLDILQRFKQGQVEVEQAAVVTDYADAILIHNSNIKELNNDITASGSEKVKILKEIKDFKKGIRAVEWETEMLDYTAGTLEVEYRHLHTLRVTKSMQEFIKGGGEGHNETERAKLLKKIDHVKKTFEAKVEEKKKAILKIKRLIKEKAMENVGLEDHTASAAQLVKERDEIVSLQSTGLDQARALKMMKDLRVTRKLEDVARAQQEELQELKTRIDKLRERTFPSFAVVSKRVVGNPDENARTGYAG